jgi:hypothetical protein
MPRTVPRMVLGVLALAATFTGRDAKAQAPGPGSMPLTNPYMNPYLNPYLNPAMTSQPMTRNDSLLYLWSAQQMPGGLLGGPTQAGPGVARGSTRMIAARPNGVRTGVAEMPKSAMQPGGGASRYFNGYTSAGPSIGAPASKFQRHDRYFSNNGR